MRPDANTRLVEQLGKILSNCVDAVLTRSDAQSEGVKMDLLKRLHSVYKQRALFGMLAQPLLRKVVNQLFDATVTDAVAYTDALLMPLATAMSSTPSGGTFFTCVFTAAVANLC